MKPIVVSLLIPLCSASAWISGTVVDLSGKPLPGVVVASSSESDVSKPSGGWILGRLDGIRRTAATFGGPASSLSLRDGRLAATWKGRDLQGRQIPTPLATVSPLMAAGARSAQMRPETLQVFFKGKRLVWLPLTSSDTDGVEIQIDTAWNDDHGIPWNSRVRYGSLRDARDGKVYRIVEIGSQTWMAENLAFGGAVPYGGRIPGWAARAKGYTGTLDGNGTLRDYDSIGVCYGGLDMNCQIYGRLYSWYEAVGDTTAYSHRSRLPVQGACPDGWRVPNDSDWAVFTTLSDGSGVDYLDSIELNWQVLNPRIPMATPSVHHVDGDLFGFRALAGGYGRYDGLNGRQWSNYGLLAPPRQPRHVSDLDTWDLGKTCRIWSANFPQMAGPGVRDPGFQIALFDTDVPADVHSIGMEADVLSSLRCVKTGRTDSR